MKLEICNDIKFYKFRNKTNILIKIDFMRQPTNNIR